MPQDPKDAKNRHSRITAMRRANADKIRKDLRENGRSVTPTDPPLIDPTDIPLKKDGTRDKRKKVGGQSKYDSKYVNMVREMCRLGATDIEVARALSISLSVLWEWQGRYEEFFRAFLEGKDYCDDRVERALYQRAVGYSHPAVKIMNYQGEAVVVPYVEHLPPDVSAATKWLKSRRKDQWGEKTELDVKGDEAFKSLWAAISSGSVLPVVKPEDEEGSDG